MVMIILDPYLIYILMINICIQYVCNKNDEMLIFIIEC